MWKLNLPLEYVFDFDVYNDQYLVLYVGLNRMIVYEINMLIYLNYRMELPLY